MHRRITVAEGNWITGEYHEMSGRDERSDRERVADAIGELDSAQFEIGRGSILELDKFETVGVLVCGGGRVIHDFGHQQIGEVLNEVEGGIAQGAPVATVECPGLEANALIEHEGP